MLKIVLLLLRKEIERYQRELKIKIKIHKENTYTYKFNKEKINCLSLTYINTKCCKTLSICNILPIYHGM